jgi:hypothetical protein
MRMKEGIQFTCCICGKAVRTGDKDAYVLQIRRVGMPAPEMLWGHGSCLRDAIPVMAEEIPN